MTVCLTLAIIAFRSRILTQFLDAYLFPYSGGRWLRNNKLQREARYVQFNFEALCRKVLAACRTAASISDFTKIERGFNKVFIFTCNNQERVLARLPTSVAGPPRLVTNSEVATIAYSRSYYVPSLVSGSND